MKSYGSVSRVLLLLLVMSGLTGCLALKEGGVVLADDDTSVSVVFSDNDRGHIQDYYHKKKKKKHMPPGLAKRDRLPPGLEKQLHERGKLPPGLEGRSLPDDLERKLSRVPEGYMRVVVGGDIVLMNKKTRVVVDIIKDIAW